MVLSWRNQELPQIRRYPDPRCDLKREKLEYWSGGRKDFKALGLDARRQGKIKKQNSVPRIKKPGRTVPNLRLKGKTRPLKTWIPASAGMTSKNKGLKSSPMYWPVQFSLFNLKPKT
jgi:hypothetical protein